MTFASIARQWNLFFFSPVSPYPVAAFRILFGLMIIQTVIFLAPDLYTWYGVPGIVEQETVYFDAMNKLNLLSLYPDSNDALTVIYALLILASICFTIGFRARLATTYIFMVLATFAGRDLYLYNSGDTFMRSMAFWFIFADSSRVWSIDSMLSRRKDKDAPKLCPLISAWGWRAMQLQISLVYFSAFGAKTSGWYWAQGEAVYIASRFESLARYPLPVSFDVDVISMIFTWGTLAVEFALCYLVWIKEIRYYVLVCGLCLHLTIDWVMCIPQFEWLMITSFILFIDTKDILLALSLLKCMFFRNRPRGEPVLE